MHICSRSTLVDLTPNSILAATELPPGADHANQFRRPLELCRCASKAQEENSVGRNVQGCAGYAPCARSLRASPPGRREVDLRWTHMPPPPPTVCHAFHPTPPASVTASSDAAAAAAIAAHRLPAPLAARAAACLPPRPDIMNTRPPPTPPPLIGRRERGCFFGVGFPRRDAVPTFDDYPVPVLAARSSGGTPQLTASLEIHIEPRRLCPARPVRRNSIPSFCSNDSLGRPRTLRSRSRAERACPCPSCVESTSLLKKKESYHLGVQLKTLAAA